jgi:hypothetical protein
MTEDCRTLFLNIFHRTRRLGSADIRFLGLDGEFHVDRAQAVAALMVYDPPEYRVNDKYHATVLIDLATRQFYLGDLRAEATDLANEWTVARQPSMDAHD